MPEPKSADAAVRQARDAFLAADHTRPLSWRVASGTAVRPHIVSSWDRSRLAGVRPDAIRAPYRDLARSPGLLSGALASIEWLAEHLNDPSASVLLADHEGRIIERRGGFRQFVHHLDVAQIAPGYVFAEQAVGTNAIGTALIDAQYTEVRGAEHFCAALDRFWGAAAPISDPVGGGTAGVVAIVCDGRDGTRFLQPLVLGAVRDINRALIDHSPDAEQVLLTTFLAESHRSNEPLIALSPSVFIGNQSGLQLLQRSSRQRLWEQISGQLDARRPATILLETSTGSTLTAHATALTRGDQVVGALLRLSIATRSLTSVRRIPALPTPQRRYIPGDSPAAHRLRRAIHLAGTSAKPALVIGEPGVGRSHVARVLLHELADTSPVVVLNLSNDTMDGVRSNIAALRANGRQRLLLRDIDRAPESLAGLDSLLVDAIARGSRIVATAADAGSVKRIAIAGLFSTLVQVPPLRARLDDLGAIATDILVKLAGSPYAAPELSEQALAALTANDWPGNVRELQSILAAALSASGREPVIRLDHLPGRYRAPDRERRMSAIERAERKAIEDALQYADGNKLAAANTLGIARSTLYRKMRALGIAAD